mgnify:CR=1 FL=1
MIRIINQEEFEKCCNMCNSRDIESRLLGISLLNGCVEYLNTGNIIIEAIFPEKIIYQYDWFEFIDACVNCSDYDSFGNLLYYLLYRGIYKECSITCILKENDQSN